MLHSYFGKAFELHLSFLLGLNVLWNLVDVETQALALSMEAIFLGLGSMRDSLRPFHMPDNVPIWYVRCLLLENDGLIPPPSPV